MSGFHAVVVPVGKLDVDELEAALNRATKLVRAPVELRETLVVPRGTEDVERKQHRAAALLDRLRKEVVKLRPGRLIGAAEGTPIPPRPDVFLFVTDVDLFTAKTDGVFAALVRSKQAGVVSVRRLREAFYRRPTDPVRQRARLVKEIARVLGRLRGVSECPDPNCILSASRTVPDLDLKEERFCRRCEQNLFEGKIQI